MFFQTGILYGMPSSGALGYRTVKPVASGEPESDKRIIYWNRIFFDEWVFKPGLKRFIHLKKTFYEDVQKHVQLSDANIILFIVYSHSNMF